MLRRPSRKPIRDLGRESLQKYFCKDQRMEWVDDHHHRLTHHRKGPLLPRPNHGRIFREARGRSTQSLRWGRPCLRPINIWETRYRNMQIFGKHVIETDKLYIMISLRGGSSPYFRQSTFQTMT